MLGTGIQFSSPALSGAGGGAWNPSQLTLIGAYEMWDRTSLMQSYRNLVNNQTSFRPVAKTKVDTDPIGVIVDKAQLPGWDGTQTFQEWLDATTPDLDFDFTSSTGWTLPGGWAITAGELQHTTATTENATYASGGIADSTYYYVEVEFDSYTSGSFSILLGNNTTSLNVNGAATSTYQCLLWSGTGGDGSFKVQSLSLIGNIESIKVWEAPGNHLFATANDRASLQTDGNGITFIRTSNGDWFMSDNLVSVAGTRISMLAMWDPNDASLENYGGLVGIGDNGTSNDSILWGNSSGASTFTANLLTDDGTTTTDEYTRLSANTALQINEYDFNGATSWQVWEDNVSQGSGTPATTVDMTGQTSINQISLGTTPAASDSFNSWGDLYAMYLYEDARSEDLFTYVNTNTGTNF